jgi:hypothetical protein
MGRSREDVEEKREAAMILWELGKEMRGGVFFFLLKEASKNSRIQHRRL